MPVYNCEKSIKKSIENIRNQTYKNIEIILVDDGSTDNSGKICDELSNKDSRIKVYHQTNKGPSAARNVGINNAMGEYLTFIDSDDIISPELVYSLFSILKKYNADITTCETLHIFSKDDVKFKYDSRVKLYTSIAALNDMLYQKEILISAWGKLFKKSLFNSIRFPEDMDFYEDSVILRVFLKANRVIKTYSNYYGYVHRKNSLTNQFFSKSDLNVLKICNFLEHWKPENYKLQKAIRAYCVNANLRIWLNIPNKSNYIAIREACFAYVKKYGKYVIKDKDARQKSRIALSIFFVNKRLLKKIYPKVNRWK